MRLHSKKFILISMALSWSTAALTADLGRVDRANFSVEETRQFTSYGDSASTLKMSVAQVPDEFECPLFSNSPYQDILSALDGLQTSINVFPKCGTSDKANELMSTSSVDLRRKILEAQELQEKGETKKLGFSADQILSGANRLQDLISRVSTEGDCYKSQESKNLIFSINDAFQSIAPLALDFAAQNPTLSPILAKSLPLVAGAKAVSKGISVLESALKYVPTLDMSVSENRMAVIKNTCSFMKLYNKIEYLTLDRASRLEKINRDFDSKINASRMIKKSVLESLGVMTLASNPTDAEIIQIKDRSEKYQNLLVRATDELGTQAKSSAIGSCSVIKTIFGLKTAAGVLNDMSRLAQILQKEDQIAFKKTKLEEYEAVMNQPDSLKDVSNCAELGQEWLMAQKEALSELKAILVEYDSQNQGTVQQSVAKIKINREEKKTADLQANKAKLNIFADLSVFEPGELEKRMRGMPRYLFNGPDGNWFSKLRKNGPVYDLLHDNEVSFEGAMERYGKSVLALHNFEYMRILDETLKAKPQQGVARGNLALQRYQLEANSFKHLSTQFAKPGTYEHRELCNKSKLAIKAYVEATDHLLSSEYLCKMIDPVLKEQEVSMWLRRYCQDSKGLISSGDVKAGYKELARPLFYKGGPKQQIEVIMQRFDKLECD